MSQGTALKLFFQVKSNKKPIFMPKRNVSLLTVHIYLLSANGNNSLSGNNNRGCCFHLHTMASLQSETCALQ